MHFISIGQNLIELHNFNECKRAYPPKAQTTSEYSFIINEILLCRMKSNPPLPNLAKQISSTSGGFIPTWSDLIEKDCNFVSKLQSFFGGQ